MCLILLKPTILFATDDHAKLWLEDELVIDTNQSHKGTYNCVSDILHSIKIDFIEVSAVTNN